jgi:hypothetical protein
MADKGCITNINGLTDSSTSGDESNEETQEKIQRRRAAKGKMRADKEDDERDEQADEEESTKEEEETEFVGVSSEINILDTLCNQSVIALCRINVFDPPAEIVFGKWNDRHLKESEAVRLLQSITETKFSPFAAANHLPLILPRYALDPMCMKTNPNVEEAAFLSLTDDARKKRVKLTFAGGRHRQWVSYLLRERCDKEIEKLTKLIADLKKKAMNKGKAPSVEKIQRWEKMVNEEKVLRERVGIWGVTVYDWGE